MKHFLDAISELIHSLYLDLLGGYTCDGGTWTPADDERLTHRMSDHSRGPVGGK